LYCDASYKGQDKSKVSWPPQNIPRNIYLARIKKISGIFKISRTSIVNLEGHHYNSKVLAHTKLEKHYINTSKA